MKLQIQEQQLNLQLKPEEIEDLKEGFPLAVNVSFGAALAPFTCELSGSYEQSKYSIAYHDGIIAIKAPMSKIFEWESSHKRLEFNVRADALESLGVCIELEH